MAKSVRTKKAERSGTPVESTVVFYSGFAGPIQAEPEHTLAHGTHLMLSFWRSWDAKNKVLKVEDRVVVAAGGKPRGKGEDKED